MKKAILVLAGTVLSVSGFSQDVKAFAVGSSETFSMNIQRDGASGSPGSPAGAAPAGRPAIDTSFISKMPADKQAQMRAALKQTQATMSGAAQKQKNTMANMDMQMKFSITGEEKRNGKPYVWMEMSYLAKSPYGTGANSNPFFTKDGKIRMVMKMLIDDPRNPNMTMDFAIQPIEMWKIKGDNPAYKCSQGEVDTFNLNNMTERDRQKKATGSTFMENVVKIPGVKSNPGMIRVAKMFQATSSAQGDLQAKTQTVQQPSGGSSGGGDYSSRTISRETSVAPSMEDIEVPGAGKVSCLHFYEKTVKQDYSNGQVVGGKTETTTEYWFSPLMPGMGMAKMVSNTDAKGNSPKMTMEMNLLKKADTGTETEIKQ